MGKHTHGKARASPAANPVAASQRRGAAGYPDLAALAARHGRALHNVLGDDQCLFHALLHALEAQVRDPRAKEYTALTLRHAILDLLCDPGLRDRAWVAACDQDAVSLTNLRETLRVNAARFEGRSLDDWDAPVSELDYALDSLYEHDMLEWVPVAPGEQSLHEHAVSAARCGRARARELSHKRKQIGSAPPAAIAVASWRRYN